MNPFLRWAGSKRRLLPRLEEFWSGNSSRYIEPFCGSACLFFSIEPSEAVLGDLNKDLINTYESLKTAPDAVIAKVKLYKRSKRAYYETRAQDPARLSPVERAARFIFLNRHCFNGIYRTNSEGKFNVPYGPQVKDSAPNEALLRGAAELLKRATLIAADFSATLKHVREGDFVYLDPPYVVRKRRVFCEYLPNSFCNDDLAILADWLDEIESRKAHFLISYADSSEARHLLGKWNAVRVRTRRNVAGFIGNRRCAYELLATNMPLPAAKTKLRSQW